MTHIDRPEVFERILIDMAGDLPAISERFSAAAADDIMRPDVRAARIAGAIDAMLFGQIPTHSSENSR